MSQEDKNGSGQENQWFATIDFYDSNPRSAQLRGICIEIINRLDALLHDPNLAESQKLHADLNSELELYEGELIGLGVKKNMHVGKPLNAFKSNSVTAAEYVAGQLIGLMSRDVIPETEAMPFSQEFNEAKGLNSAHVIYAENMPPKLVQFIGYRGAVELLRLKIAAETKDNRR